MPPRDALGRPMSNLRISVTDRCNLRCAYCMPEKDYTWLRREDFFALGGHSLLATQVTARVRQAFAIDLPLQAVFEAPTVAGLSERVRATKGTDEVETSASPPLTPLVRGGPLPLSFAQQRLWFLDQLDPGQATYNLPYAVRLTGPLGVDAVARSFTTIVARHEILRTRLPISDGSPTQVVQAAAPVQMPLVDLSALGRHAETIAIGLAQGEAARAFDLARGPMLRVTLVRLTRASHVLLLTLHHIASDGWSVALLVREFAEAYAAAIERREPVLPSLPVQYADFAAWQRDWLQGGVLAEQIDFWRRQLANLPALELPIADSPAVRSHRGSTASVPVGPDLTRAVHAVGRDAHVTPFMVLLAAFQVLLARYSGQRDFAIGTDAAHRTHAELEPLVGLFVNQLVLRTTLDGDPTFAALLDRVRETTLDAYAHQEVPFERLVEELSPPRNLGRTPFFQAKLVLQNVPLAPVEACGLVAEPVPLATSTAKFDLLLTFVEENGELHGTLEYASDLFDRPTIARLAHHVVSVLGALTADPTRRALEAPFLTPADIAGLLADGCGAREPCADVPAGALFARQAARTPDAIAVVSDETVLTYAALAERAARLSYFLRELGAGSEAPVALFLDRHVDVVIAVLGVLQAGSAYLPLDVKAPVARLALMLDDAAVPIVLTHERVRPLLPTSYAQVVSLDALWPTILDTAGPPSPSPDHIDGSQIAYVLYTSGSTGQPKGVEVPQAALVNHMRWMTQAFGFTSDDAIVQRTAVTFDASVWELFAPLLAGCRLVLAPPAAATDPVALAAVIVREQATVLQTVPSLLAEMIAAGDLDACRSLRWLFCGGEPLRRDLVTDARRHSRASIVNLYGPTEATIDATAHVVEIDPRDGSISIGLPIANAHAYVVDDAGQLAPEGVWGELWIGGQGLARGYANRPRLTAERFVPNPFAEVGCRVYRTGDRVRWRAGRLEYLGRADHQVKLRGYRIELEEIESRLCAQSDVDRAVVMLREDHPGDQRLVAYVVTRTGAAPDITFLRDALAAHLPEYMMPSLFVGMSALPLTRHGKVDRRALPLPQPTTPGPGSVGPRTPVEARLSEIWSDVLHVAPIGAHDNFFELGGHSLLGTQVMARIRRELHLDVPLRALFEAPTLARLATVVETARRDSAPPLVPVGRAAPLPLSFAQQRLWFLEQLNPGQPTYNQPHALRLAGPLDLNALAAAFTLIVERHEVLRTAFALADDAPVQQVQPPASVPAPVVDLCGLGDEAEAVLQQVMRAEARRPFDLAAAPLLRVRVLRLTPATHVLFVAVHHIVCDGWSMGLLVREFAECYAAALERRPPALPALPIQYGDFAHWQRRWLQDAVLDDQLAYWRQQLAGVPALDLPIDAPRPAIESHRGALAAVRLSPALTGSLHALGRDTQSTLFMTLAAGFALLLARVSGQRDFAIGTDIANRTFAETEPLVGFFVNQLVLRINLDGNPSFRDVLGRVRETLLDAYVHQDAPFERLVEELAPRRDLGRAPLFQTKLVLQNLPDDERAMRGLTVTPLEIQEQPARSELAVLLREEDGGLTGVVEYATDLFTPETVGRLMSQWETLLARAVERPDAPAWTLPMTSAAEAAALEALGTGPTAGIDSDLRSYVLVWASTTPDAIAIVGEGDDAHVSYGTVAAQVTALATELASLGVGPDVCVALALDPGPALVVSVLAVLQAGGAYVPLDSGWPTARVAAVLDQTRAPVILTHEARRARLPASWAHVISLDAPLSTAAIPFVPRRPAPTQLAYVLYTSGSTGRPKGVMVTYAGLANYLRWSAATYSVGRGAGTRLHTPVAFDLTVTSLFGGLIGGRGVRIAATPDLETLHAALAAETPYSLIKVTPSHLRGLAAWAGTRHYAVHTCVVGGEALTGETVTAWWTHAPGSRVINEYGPTETVVGCCWHEVTSPAPAGPVPIGLPIANTRVYVVESGDSLASIGVVGELWIGGVGVARGYVGQPGLTADRFVPDPFSGEPGARVYRTGDRARWRADGVLEYLGRFDAQMKLRGYRIEPGEIETVLAAQPGVRHAVVALREDAPSDPRLVAYVVADGGDLEAWQTALRAQLPEYMLPSAIVPLEALPLSANGKLDRSALPAPVARTTIPAVPPRTRLEARLAAIWMDVLHRPNIGVHDNFFELGGHSLLGTQIIARLRRELRIDVPLRALFETPSIAGLAFTIAGHAWLEDADDEGLAPRISAADEEHLLATLDDLSAAALDSLIETLSVNTEPS
jgi:amino acid adenylation domain-containing protein